MGTILASDWSSDVRSHVVWETADQVEKGIAGSPEVT